MIGQRKKQACIVASQIIKTQTVEFSRIVSEFSSWVYSTFTRDDPGNNNSQGQSNDPRVWSNDPKVSNNDRRFWSNDPRVLSKDPKVWSNDP